MTQKDKVKELVGGGLNAYHTKALQQMNRIEKKNKQQNHKISILSNELDNDYLTKTEEGSVVSLEYSKEGMVYLDELQGNTLVNYCTDGSKELTLNGDIDLEGTFVTTTEGVDGGKVDVLCEGNTLILDENGNEVEAGSEGARLVSVGQDDENGHKIEILSHNNFLGMNDGNITLRSSSSRQAFNKFTIIGSESWNSEVHFNVNSSDVPIGTNIKIRIKVLENTNPSANNSILKSWVLTDFNVGNFDYSLLNEWQEIEYNVNREYNGSADSKINLMIFGLKNTALPTDRMVAEIEVEINNSKKSNKKEILLNEPLRKANDNVKDRFVKINGKLYIERNCKQLTITGNEPNVVWRSDGILGNVYRFWSNNFPNCITLNADGCVFMGSYEGVYQANAINIQISTSKIAEDNVELFVEYLKQNPLTLVIKRDKPIYEPLEINPELICYNDTTHISNNSIIPCNMKIQNSGYNAIIKPSTLYTIALDTNKSGTIGMNLGGVKGTTTNNVLTLTTPATLTDDSLRLYGKGIKGSKVRLLEGDKTNWIPSFFEGMKSSFEDKLQDDGTYKMEILSNNINLFDKNIFTNLKDINKWVGEAYKNSNVILKLKPNTKYTMSIPELYVKNNSYWIFEIRDESTTLCSILNWSHNNSSNSNDLRVTPRKITFTTKTGYLYVNAYMNNWNILETMCEYLNKDFMLVEGTEEKVFVDNKSNKIQFSSIEPLRGVENVRDRFVFKDGKLMIERNCGEVTLNGGEDEHWTYHALEPSNKYAYRTNCFSSKSKPQTSVKCNNFVSGNPSSAWTHRYNNIAILNTNNCLIYCDIKTLDGFKQWIQQNPTNVVYQLAEPYYEEIPFELQKIILEGYENGTLFFDTNIPPTSTVTYAGETPIVSAIKSNKSNVISNTNDINDNIIPYLMDMDYRVVCLELATETQGISMARLFGGTYEMLKRDILSKRYSVEEYKYRLDAYLSVNKITEKEYEELGEMLNE